MFKKLKNQKGATSLLWVIAIFIAAIIISGFVGIVNRTVLINEIQGMMDMSGVTALRYAVDEPALRSKERLYVDSGVAKSKFVESINQNMKYYTGDGKMIKSYKIETVNIIKDDKTALKKSIQGKDEYFLEAVIIASYNMSSYVDKATINAVNYFDFLWSNKRASVSTMDNMGDGKGDVIIRTVSRLALR